MYAILDEVTYMTLKTESSISLKFRLHTLIHTFSLETKLPNSVVSFRRGKCEFMDAN